MSKAFDRIKTGLEEALALDKRVVAFVTESNRIEGIYTVKAGEVMATSALIETTKLTLDDVLEVQSAYAPGMPLRDRPGMNVGVGNYIAPRGGRDIYNELVLLIERLNRAEPSDNPWKTHVTFERLHPFMDGNGRTGRALWAWHMIKVGLDPFALPFLHRFYYQTLENDTERYVRGHGKGDPT